MQLRGWRERLVEEMMNLPISDFMKLRYWDDHLRMAFYFINDGEMEASLLWSWLATFGDDVRFAELAVSSLNRHPHGTKLVDAWSQKAHSLRNQHE